LVQIFIKHICGWTEEGPKKGLFGKPAAYYGTVEEQGRKTLHLHFLLWISGQLPLNTIRERLMSEDSEFQKELTEYIESCFMGEFMTGSKEEVSARVPFIPEFEDRGIHTILVDDSNVPEGYQDPTLTMPEAPPSEFCEEPEMCRCQNCLDLLSWWERFKMTVDDILIRSNGCINKQGVCTARFPREIIMNTSVDPKTGHMSIKKREATINDVCPTVSLTNRCNTDTQCLLSGTSVKAIVGYVTDYITKGWLKTHQVFSAAYDTFNK
ncbi:hypothetical protein DFP72DRAFT_778538, partial [Ephemerocybe angulata]